ncbi:DUF1624 domain-containing protein [Luteipulveratus flavus]|uniref:Heparan-alpha-glucosaminide N-acetyltransferase n=1 Tax=Luteipulveratus flavus TaxID=3031728 RepID=A0ABT6C770_9MICO|nr:heparan-alpha-glucosaminide N-acetyltransferase [Luteipulveratus sp. YIM 133296]MDF8264162.1 heparan-alpha-glucosaminide N-acetyltransferase [Luteipulveratus sp. YIM 133296]
MTLTARRRPASTTATRLVAVDVVRGVAILAVIAFHLTWDLGSLDLIGTHIGSTPWGRAISHTIAGTFLLLVGVSLVLAHRERFRAASFWRREVQLVGYAVLVSVATYLFLPHQWVSFGILHAIAVSSVLALPFVHASRATAVGAIGLAVALPQLVTIPGDSRWWSWTGLTEGVRPTIDSAPLLPMLALTLAGVLVMRSLQGSATEERLASWRPERGAGGALAFLGRHTLAIYLLHQPVLLVLLHGYVLLR